MDIGEKSCVKEEADKKDFWLKREGLSRFACQGVEKHAFANILDTATKNYDQEEHVSHEP